MSLIEIVIAFVLSTLIAYQASRLVKWAIASPKADKFDVPTYWTYICPFCGEDCSGHQVYVFALHLKDYHDFHVVIPEMLFYDRLPNGARLKCTCGELFESSHNLLWHLGHPGDHGAIERHHALLLLGSNRIKLVDKE
jgi:hypothetical protein